MNNWQKLELGSKEEGQVAVLRFLKENEGKIMSRSVSNESIITCGELVLHLFQKPAKKGKK